MPDFDRAAKPDPESASYALYVGAFRRQIGHVRTVAVPFLEEHFGSRCPDFEKDCLCCQRWAALDALVSDPFADDFPLPKPEGEDA